MVINVGNSQNLMDNLNSANYDDVVKTNTEGGESLGSAMVT